MGGQYRCGFSVAQNGSWAGMTRRNRIALRDRINSKKFERMEWDPVLRDRKTITDYLATALRTAIYDGQFADNEELNQVQLSEFFGVSRVPIREALRQLQAEGLVRNIAHHRTIVTGLTLPQILESIEMRAVLEAHLLCKAEKRFDQSAIDKLRKICDETDQIKDYGARWVLKNWEFHRALYSRAESPTIVEAVERIQLNTERYARRTGSPERLRQAAAEHRQILSALERRDFAKASARLERHILNTGEAIRREHEEKASATNPAKPAKAPAKEERPAR
jgi:DNA-binding GntR family transcriptional regulator